MKQQHLKGIVIVIILLMIYAAAKAQVPEFSDSLMYRSLYNETKYGEKVTHSPEATFRFENDLMITTMEDQFSRFRTYGVVSTGEDSDHIWKTHQCLDNSGTSMYVTLAYEKPSQTQVIMLDYGNVLFYFEVEAREIPQEAFDIMENLESLGHLHDGNFGTEYTDEEVEAFLSEFGDSSFIMKVMLYDLFYHESFGVNNKPQNWQKQ
jgi:hypothetical protein